MDVVAVFLVDVVVCNPYVETGVAVFLQGARLSLQSSDYLTLFESKTICSDV